MANRGSEHTSAIVRATTADDMLTVLASIEPATRRISLWSVKLPILREAADLCGVGDADCLTKQQAINAIVSNF